MKNRNDLAKYFFELGFTTGAEVGVDKGDYSEILCNANPSLKLYAVDCWDLNPGIRHDRQARNYIIAQEKLANQNVVFVKKYSVDAAKDFEDKSLDFVYIDADHRFDPAMMDILVWGKKVRKGGIIAGHDYSNLSNGGVKDAVDTYVKQHGYHLEVLPEPSGNWKLRDGNTSEAITWWCFRK